MKDFPADSEVQLDLAGGYSQLGQIFLTRSDFAQALQNDRQSVALREAAVARKPTDTSARRGLMISYANVADVLGSPFVPNMGDVAGAREYYQKVVAIARELAAADPNDRLAQSDLAHALSRYAMLEPPPEEREQSLRLLREAHGVLEKLLAAAREFPLRARERLTFEYVLLDGVNDAPEHARQRSRNRAAGRGGRQPR
jgi:tetratricopeptide (TPR) repeat protein